VTPTIQLKSSHLYFPQEIVTEIFGEIIYAYVTYVEDQKRILVTPVSSVWFTKMYEPKQFMLKARNLKGDRTVAIHELLIDNDLDAADRDLEYEMVQRTNLIKIKVA